MSKRASIAGGVYWPAAVVLAIVGAPLCTFATETTHNGGRFVGPPIKGSSWRPAKVQGANHHYYRQRGSRDVRSQSVLANQMATPFDVLVALGQGRRQREHHFELVRVGGKGAATRRMILATTFPVGPDGRARSQMESMHLISLGGRVWQQMDRNSEAVFLGSVPGRAVDLPDLTEALHQVVPPALGATSAHDSPGRLLGVENRQYQVRYTLTHNNNLVQRKYAVDPTTGRLGAEPVRVVTIFRWSSVVIEGLPSGSLSVRGTLDGKLSIAVGGSQVLRWGSRNGETLEQAVDGLFDTAQ